jgi:hypothetical protein
MGVRRVRSNTRNEPPHAPALALLRTLDLVLGICVGPLNDVHGPLDHERHASTSLQVARAFILGQPPRCPFRKSAASYAAARLEGLGGYKARSNW